MEVKNIVEVINAATQKSGNKDLYCNLHSITKLEAEKILQITGFDVTGYIRMIDTSSIRHTIKNHGDEKREKLRGQIAVTYTDFLKIPTIAKPENLIYFGVNRQGNKIFLYQKKIGNLFFYVEEIRTGRKKLCLNSLYKRKPPAISKR